MKAAVRTPEANRGPGPCPIKPPRALALVLLSLWTTLAFASPSSALRDYKDGNYEKALKEYEQILQRKPDDARLHFNAGTAAYRNGRFAEATNQFNAALNSPDLKLQESAYYNRGNSSYWLGEKAPDPKQRSEAWERSLKDYDLTLKLNPQDVDAKFNRDFVKKRLEELKQQQQQQQQSKQDKSDQQKQDQQQQQQQNDQDKQQQNQQQQQQAKQDQSQQQQDSSQQNQQQQAEQKKQDQQQQQAAQQQQQQQQQASSQAQQNQEEKERQAAAYAAGQMTPEQAQQLLDAQKGEERMLPVKPEGKPVDRSRPIKDW